MKNGRLNKIYKSLPRANKFRSKIRDQIIKECGITRTIFYNWTMGVTTIDEYSLPIVAKILNVTKEVLLTKNDL